MVAREHIRREGTPPGMGGWFETAAQVFMLRSQLPALRLPPTTSGAAQASRFAILPTPCDLPAEMGLSPYLAGHAEPETWAVGRTQGAIS